MNTWLLANDLSLSKMIIYNCTYHQQEVSVWPKPRSNFGIGAKPFFHKTETFLFSKTFQIFLMFPSSLGDISFYKLDNKDKPRKLGTCEAALILQSLKNFSITVLDAGF